MLRIEVTQTRHTKSAVSLEVFILLLCKIHELHCLCHALPLVRGMATKFSCTLQNILARSYYTNAQDYFKVVIVLGKTFFREDY